ncbi:MAG: hypothetical protein A2W25_16805 [candidate division Zixibacteria bacterium RBG_16_53_22]|nr:MAG: hypothetical protein A2W25_16805 [candidate division Zixibacteria bacterium RBG_16_53_22]
MLIRTEQGRPKSPIHLIWGGIAIAGIALVGLLKNHLELLPACVFKKATGIACLTCGATRSVTALSDFRLADSFLFNPLAMLFLVGLIAFSFLVGFGLIFGRRLEIRMTARESWIIRSTVIGAVVANWIYLISHLA